mmetsp:Transcript_17478/g.26304  ORF Transcript_17478/g.26304 Transcript_17478/m.26304 type:complete len:221 (-) Transcript_17478:600-1262(-)
MVLANSPFNLIFSRSVTSIGDASRGNSSIDDRAVSSSSRSCCSCCCANLSFPTPFVVSDGITLDSTPAPTTTVRSNSFDALVPLSSTYSRRRIVSIGWQLQIRNPFVLSTPLCRPIRSMLSNHSSLLALLVSFFANDAPSGSSGGSAGMRLNWIPLPSMLSQPTFEHCFAPLFFIFFGDGVIICDRNSYDFRFVTGDAGWFCVRFASCCLDWRIERDSAS